MENILKDVSGSLGGNARFTASVFDRKTGEWFIGMILYFQLPGDRHYFRYQKM